MSGRIISQARAFFSVMDEALSALAYKEVEAWEEGSPHPIEG